MTRQVKRRKEYPGNREVVVRMGMVGGRGGDGRDGG